MLVTLPLQQSVLRAGLAGAAAACLAGCATTVQPEAESDPVGAALAQPLHDLNLVRGEAPQALVRAAEAPYRATRDCADISAELAELDGLLGPDIDATQVKGGAADFVGAVVSSAAGLPFRGVVRRLTGAHQRDEAVAAAILGAAVRRGYLKGERAALDCDKAGS